MINEINPSDYNLEKTYLSVQYKNEIGDQNNNEYIEEEYNIINNTLNLDSQSDIKRITLVEKHLNKIKNDIELNDSIENNIIDNRDDLDDLDEELNDISQQSSNSLNGAKVC